MSGQNTCDTERIQVGLNSPEEAREQAGFSLPELPRRKWRRTGRLPDGALTWASEEREPHEDHVFEEGYKAGLSGRGIGSNPYRNARYELLREWELGYETGLDERMEAKRIKRLELDFND